MVPTSDLISEQLSLLADEFAARMSELAGSDPNIRIAVLKSGVRDLIWAIEERFDESEELADMLRILEDLVRHQKRNEK